MNSFIIISQLGSDHSASPPASSQNPNLFRQKPQIAIIPGISPKDRNRYRVILGTEILGDQLAIDEALKLAKGGKL